MSKVTVNVRLINELDYCLTTHYDLREIFPDWYSYSEEEQDQMYENSVNEWLDDCIESGYHIRENVLTVAAKLDADDHPRCFTNEVNITEMFDPLDWESFTDTERHQAIVGIIEEWIMSFLVVQASLQIS